MSDEGEKLAQQIRTALPQPWPPWPGGWPGKIESAVLDSVFSVRARYGSETTGVRAVVGRWKAHRGDELDDLNALARYLDNPTELQSILGNQQTLPGGLAKAEGAARAAAALSEAGVRHSPELTGTDKQRRAWCSVKGLGEVTWSYTLMLLGVSGVKADVMVRRFVDQAIGPRHSAAQARALVLEAASVLKVAATALDHAIWRQQRAKRSR